MKVLTDEDYSVFRDAVQRLKAGNFRIEPFNYLVQQ